ncbi:MAG TPA: EamA family transporter [Anaerolineales bacterium]|jgi:drug/metabolite transporter (DMT)-like permease
MHDDVTTVSSATRPDAMTLLAFAGMTTLVAGNFVAVRFSNFGLPPFWGAGLRFGAAALLFLGYMWLRSVPWPDRRGLVTVLAYGVFQFGAGYALVYWGLQRVPAGLASVIIATAPLFTILFTALLGLEKPTWRGLAGALIGLAGVAYLYWERAGVDIPPAYLVATVAAAVCFCLGPVVVKRFGRAHPAATNGIAMLVGATILFPMSMLAGEPAGLPQDASTWLALVYLVLLGSVGLFALLLYSLERWTATAVSYQVVISPVLAFALSAWLLDEPLTSGLLVGGLLVLVGVYLGTLAPGESA